jgi:hypothetical protein
MVAMAAKTPVAAAVVAERIHQTPDTKILRAATVDLVL